MVEVRTPNPAKPHRPAWKRRTLQILVLSAMLLAAGFGGTFLWRHITSYMAQNACLIYTAPPTDVVFETENAAATALFATHHDSVGFFGPEGNARFGALPSCRLQFGSHLSPSESSRWGDIAYVFLHERVGRGPGGQRRLVEVFYCADTEESFRFNYEHMTELGIKDLNQIPLAQLYDGEVWKPGSLFSYPSRIGDKFPRTPNWRNIIFPTRIYAGQPDPADASHFTFDYEAYGTRDTVDGWLEADDSVTLTPRHPPMPPATAPATEGLLRK